MVTPAIEVPAPIVETTPAVEVVETAGVPTVVGEAGIAVEPPVAGEVSVAPTLALQEELVSLRRQVAQATSARDAATTQATLQRSAQAVYDEELAAGLSAEDALRIAQRHYTTSAQAMAQQQVERDRLTVAEHVGKKYNVPPTALMAGTSGEHMETIAQLILIRNDIEVLKKGRVPAQKVDSGNGSRASNVALTADNIDKLWFDHETQHPGAANPYDAVYRKSMER